MLFEVISK
ncbi:hypothetical protein D027_4819A, partial [Vibrio parahaemolyticus 861]